MGNEVLRGVVAKAAKKLQYLLATYPLGANTADDVVAVKDSTRKTNPILPFVKTTAASIPKLRH